MHKVKTIYDPNKTVEVGDAEYTDLQRQGLLVKDTKSTNTQADKADEKKGK